MSELQYKFITDIQKMRFNERLRRKPFLKIVEETKDMAVPLCYDSRTENEVMNYIKFRMRRKLVKNQIQYLLK